VTDLNSLYDFSDLPDLVGAWPCQIDRCSARLHRGLAPRGAYVLWVSARILADQWREWLAVPTLADTRHPGLDPSFDALPAIARRVGSLAWLDRFIGCFDELGDTVARGDLELTCTGEEVAFQVLLADAARRLGEEGAVVPPDFDVWPGHGDAFDFDLSRIETIVCWDTDVCLLWQADLDGIEADEAAGFAHVGAVNLHPKNWFEPFHGVRRTPAPGPAQSGL
jgi:hypothetical protein